MADYLTPGHVFLATAAYLLLCGVAGCYVSAQKGRSCGEGFLLAFLFGPAGLIVAACLPAVPGPGHAAGAEEDEEDAAARRHLKSPGAAPANPLDRLLDGMERKARSGRESRPSSGPAASRPAEGPSPLVGRTVRKLMGEVEE